MTLDGRPRVELEVVEDRSASARCDEGFLRLRRLTLRHAWSDGERSAPYAYDVVTRDALDAVAIVLVTDRASPKLALRTSIRPPLALRDGDGDPVLWEVPAGLVEPHERGEAGWRRCAAREALEEVGVILAPESFRPLGPPAYLSPGVLAERIAFLVAEVDVEAVGTPTEDGSPLERRAAVRFVELDACLEACRDGRIEDLKTETAVRRALDWAAAWQRGASW